MLTPIVSVLAAVLFVISSIGCATTKPPNQNKVPLIPPPSKLMVFGGTNHETYLGCLNCSSTAYDSIYNPSGPYGQRGSYFANNLFGRGVMDDFGSTGIIQDLSACSTNANNPPVIVDKNGGYYGRFSISSYSVLYLILHGSQGFGV